MIKNWASQQRERENKYNILTTRSTSVTQMYFTILDTLMFRAGTSMQQHTSLQVKIQKTVTQFHPFMQRLCILSLFIECGLSLSVLPVASPIQVFQKVQIHFSLLQITLFLITAHNALATRLFESTACVLLLLLVLTLSS